MKQARRDSIFNAAQVMSPDFHRTTDRIRIYCSNKLELKEATKIFEAVIKKEPENHLAQTFLASAFYLTSRSGKSEKLIQEAMEKATDPTIKNLGKIS